MQLGLRRGNLLPKRQGLVKGLGGGSGMIFEVVGKDLWGGLKGERRLLGTIRREEGGKGRERVLPWTKPSLSDTLILLH